MLKPLYKCPSLAGIPTVFGDELSYYERINRVEAKVNEMINFINNNLESMIRDQLDLLFINAMYIAETETLVISLEMKEVK